MTPSDVTRTIEHCLQTLRPPMLLGPPGIGKSALVAEAARRHGIPLIDLRLSQLDSVDMRGLPMVVKLVKANGETIEHRSEYETRWIAPSFLPKTGKGILFLDELPTAMPAVQTVALQITHDRRVGDYQLPADWLVVAAGNRSSDKTHYNRMSSALASRFLMVNCECNVNDWSAWALRTGIEPEIVSCIRAQPGLIYDFDPAKWQDGTTFACPRTWAYLDETIKKCPEIFNLGKSRNNSGQSLRAWELELVQGIVGPAAGLAFFLWLQTYITLPTAEQIFADPDHAPVPDNASGRHAVSAALIKHCDTATFPKIVRYMKRLERDFLYYVVSAVVCPGGTINQALSMSPTWTDFVLENKDLFPGIS